MKEQKPDQDQQSILYVYSLYSSFSEVKYLQYTGALVIFFYLMKQNIFPDYREHLLIYDYKDTRRFLWEDKKFMTDVNTVRNNGFLSRARLRAQNYRDMNAHQCTQSGFDFLKSIGFENTEHAQKIKNHLTCGCGKLYSVDLKDNGPQLICKQCKKSGFEVKGFLFNPNQPINHPFKPAFI